MKTIGVVVGLGVFCLSGLAIAQSNKGVHGSHSGNVARQQALDRADQMFQRLDLNRDGRLTSVEAQQAHQQMATSMPGYHAEGLDLQSHHGREHGPSGHLFAGNAVITQATFRQKHLAHFEQLDRDRNGVVTTAEHQQGQSQLSHQ